MVQQLLNILPEALRTPHAAICIALLVAGLILWLVGAAWGRAILTLIAVALGGVLGILVPRWQMWPINSMSAAVLGAVGLGVSAFMVERVWSGLLLGVVLVAWTSLGVWMNLGGDQPFQFRTAEVPCDPRLLESVRCRPGAAGELPCGRREERGRQGVLAGRKIGARGALPE